MSTDRVFAMQFARVYPLYVQKVERKGRTVAELDTVIEWLTGYDAAELQRTIDDGTTLASFFDDAPALNPARSQITGTICGVRIEQIEDPTMQAIRQLDKLVDELAKGRPLVKILR